MQKITTADDLGECSRLWKSYCFVLASLMKTLEKTDVSQPGTLLWFYWTKFENYDGILLPEPRNVRDQHLLEVIFIQ